MIWIDLIFEFYVSSFGLKKSYRIAIIAIIWVDTGNHTVNQQSSYQPHTIRHLWYMPITRVCSSAENAEYVKLQQFYFLDLYTSRLYSAKMKISIMVFIKLMFYYWTSSTSKNGLQFHHQIIIPPICRYINLFLPKQCNTRLQHRRVRVHPRLPSPQSSNLKSKGLCCIYTERYPEWTFSPKYQFFSKCYFFLITNCKYKVLQTK